MWQSRSKTPESPCYSPAPYKDAFSPLNYEEEAYFPPFWTPTPEPEISPPASASPKRKITTAQGSRRPLKRSRILHESSDWVACDNFTYPRPNLLFLLSFLVNLLLVHFCVHLFSFQLSILLFQFLIFQLPIFDFRIVLWGNFSFDNYYTVPRLLLYSFVSSKYLSFIRFFHFL